MIIALHISIALNLIALGLIYWLRKEIPSIIGKVVSNIEFAQDTINRRM